MSKQGRHFYEFDSFRLDPSEQVLFRNGEPVPLSPKLFDTLLVLVRESGHIVEKDELIRRVWPDTFVEENNLSQYISTLRKTLGDERHEQRYIETVPRRGYRFTANVRDVFGEDGEALRAAHTKVSLSVKEETEEVDDWEQRIRRAHGAGKSPAPLALASLAAVAVVGAFGFYQFNGRAVPESRATGSSASARIASQQPPNPENFKIKTFDPSEWPRTDKEIGVEGFLIEDFEDTTLINGLQVELSDSTTDNFGPTGTLPNVFNPDIHDTGGARVFVAGIWDGSHVLINRRSPSPQGYADFVWGDVTFHIAGGASSFGFSLHEMDLNTELSVNGVVQVNIKRLLPSGSTRGGYLRIDATRGEPIYTVKIANHANNETGDGLAFDHVAFKPVSHQH